MWLYRGNIWRKGMRKHKAGLDCNRKNVCNVYRYFFFVFLFYYTNYWFRMAKVCLGKVKEYSMWRKFQGRVQNLSQAYATVYSYRPVQRSSKLFGFFWLVNQMTVVGLELISLYKNIHGNGLLVSQLLYGWSQQISSLHVNPVLPTEALVGSYVCCRLRTITRASAIGIKCSMLMSMPC